MAAIIPNMIARIDKTKKHRQTRTSPHDFIGYSGVSGLGKTIRVCVFVIRIDNIYQDNNAAHVTATSSGLFTTSLITLTEPLFLL